MNKPTDEHKGENYIPLGINARGIINISDTQHMLHRDIAASTLNILCQNVNPVKRYSITKMTVFVLSLWEKYRWSLTSFGQFRYFREILIKNNAYRNLNEIVE